MEPALRYLWNTKQYVGEKADEELGGGSTRMASVLERVENSLDGVYNVLNQYVGQIGSRRVVKPEECPKNASWQFHKRWASSQHTLRATEGRTYRQSMAITSAPHNGAVGVGGC